jgi:hypothetical protein
MTAELRRLANRMTRRREEANAEAERWAASERRYHGHKREELRQDWIDFHRQQAKAHEATGKQLAEFHREQARRLEEGASL